MGVDCLGRAVRRCPPSGSGRDRRVRDERGSARKTHWCGGLGLESVARRTAFERRDEALS